jgi:hypothetical protein
MTNSILDSTKKNLGIAPTNRAFDLDIITHINSVFSTLQQLGVGPTAGFEIDDEITVWGDFLGGNIPLNQVKTYVYMRVKLIFDPPANSFGISSMDDQIKEMEWRMMVLVDPPLPPPVVLDPYAV